MAGRDWPGICTDPSCRFQTPVNIDVREVVDAPQLGDLLSRAHYPVLKGNLSLFHDNGTFFFSLPQTHSYVKVPMFKMKKPFDPQSSSTWDPNNYGPGGSATTSKDDEDDVNDSDSDEDDEDGSDGEADGYGGEDQGDGDGDGEDESGSSSTRKSKSGTKWLKLKLVECHVHSLSETSVDSKQADLEMHCVHQRSGSRVPVFAVLGILMNRDESEICSPFLDKIVAALPDLLQRSVRDSMSVDVGPSFSLRAFLPLDGRYFHFYPGSLTTPPCEEGLLWYIFKQPLPICRRHLDRIRDFIHSLNGERIDNYRVVQPLNGRVIYSWTPWVLFGNEHPVVEVSLVAPLYRMRKRVVPTRGGTSTTPYTKEEEEKMAALLQEKKEKKEAKKRVLKEEQAAKLKKMEEEMAREKERLKKEEEEKLKEVDEEEEGPPLQRSSGQPSSNTGGDLEKRISEWVANLTVGEEEEVSMYIPQDQQEAAMKAWEAEKDPLKRQALEDEKRME
ncbi:hypothetical protein CBR_g3223 [Chara braunii]|uniref:carbonic anhydrase n=1 Tax=Chara braunii TaxID=69332 RepID=A0A388KF41_CHABU|nr:hypothetical protein CBR_g3223 [Chara braunii]|eukprot:GBG68682.1 hypothetical protein CBR_g3223 [Chara braunii]